MVMDDQLDEGAFTSYWGQKVIRGQIMVEAEMPVNSML